MTLDDVSIDQHNPVRQGTSSETFSQPADAAQTTGVIDARTHDKKLFQFRNTGDQAVDITIRRRQNSGDSDTRVVGSTITLAAGNMTAQEREIVITDHHNFLDVQIDPDGAMTAGEVIIDYEYKTVVGS